MQSINQKSNTLQCILGFFFQSVHAPYKAIDTLARLGVSISTNAINMAVQSLSTESENALCKLGQSLLASYAYNNFDIDLKSQVPTAEKSNNSLKHLTSGLLFPLVHGIISDNLKCSEELWRMSELNLHVERQNIPQRRSIRDLINLHPDALNASTLSHHINSMHGCFFTTFVPMDQNFSISSSPRCRTQSL